MARFVAGNDATLAMPPKYADNLDSVRVRMDKQKSLQGPWVVG